MQSRRRRARSGVARHTALMPAAAHVALSATLFLGACTGGGEANRDGGEPDGVTGEVPSTDGVPIHYAVHGSGEPALVLIHGWTNDRRIWGVHPTTLGHTHRVVTLDLAGHGESGAGRTTWSIPAFGDDVAAVVRHLGLRRVVLVGFSMGASVAVEAAHRMPDRVAGIVFVDALQDPEVANARLDPAQFEAMLRAGWRDTAWVRGFAFTPDAPDSLVQMVTASMDPTPREHWFPALQASIDWQRTALVPALSRLQAPVAAINTTRMPTNVDALRRYVPSFTVDTIQGVGHAGILLQRVDDFDARLRAIVARFTAAPGSS